MHRATRLIVNYTIVMHLVYNNLAGDLIVVYLFINLHQLFQLIFFSIVNQFMKSHRTWQINYELILIILVKICLAVRR